jgi:hypothetical protein
VKGEGSSAIFVGQCDTAVPLVDVGGLGETSRHPQTLIRGARATNDPMVDFPDPEI